MLAGRIGHIGRGDGRHPGIVGEIPIHAGKQCVVAGRAEAALKELIGFQLEGFRPRVGEHLGDVGVLIDGEAFFGHHTVEIE
ncbi:hypothetical protein D3C75_1262470 [compost metagenome]